MSSSIVIDYLHVEFHTEHIGIAYIYFDYKSAHQSTSPNVLSSLLVQLLADPRRTIPSSLEDLYRSCATKNSRPDSSQLVEIFKTVSEQFKSLFLVFDAFDECDKDERPLIVDMIRELATMPNAKLLVTGRPHQDFLEVSRFDSARTLEIKAHEEDINLYLSKELDKVRNVLSERIREKISESLQKEVDGTYILSLKVNLINFYIGFS